MKTDFAVKQIKDKVVFVDTEKAMFKGIPFKSLGAFGRRKFENLLVMSGHQKVGGIPKIRYE
jgi:hypothetical protein